MTFSTFAGQYHKLYKEMEEIGSAPTSEECYEMLRNAVVNPNLISRVVLLNLPVARRITIAEFFEDCQDIVRNSPHLDTPLHKRKADDIVVGRTVTMMKSRRIDPKDGTCYRCGQHGHLKYDSVARVRCSATACTLCHKNIGHEDHDAKNCCAQSAKRFNLTPKSDAQVQGGSNGRKKNFSQGKFKKGKKSSGGDNPSYYGPNHSSTSSGVTVSAPPITSDREASELRARLAQYDAARRPGARRVTSSEDDGSHN